MPLAPHEIRDFTRLCSDRCRDAVNLTIAVSVDPTERLQIAMGGIVGSVSVAAAHFAFINGITDANEIDPIDVGIALLQGMREAKARASR